jgi:ABC-2 type transport system ATP-binding protein
MDAIASTNFRRFLKTEVISGRGTSLLFASHSMQEIEVLADRVAILQQGIVVAIDTPAALKKKYSADSLENVFRRATEQGPQIDSEPHKP